MRLSFLSLLLAVSISCWSQTGTLYAVVVGVSDYAEGPDLKYCDSDASKIAAMFDYYKQPHEIVLLKNGDATKSAILNQLSSLYSKAIEQDIVLFYFGGHGGKGFFCPYDANRSTLITYEDIRKLLIVCKARRQLLIADACYSGAIRTSTPDSSAKHDSGKELLFFLSSRTSQMSRELPAIKGGVFTYFLLQGLRGGADSNRDRLITAKELFDFVSPKVKEGTKGQQVPVMWGNFSDQMVFLDWRNN
jgi:uncharacterized caspase-like protein